MSPLPPSPPAHTHTILPLYLTNSNFVNMHGSFGRSQMLLPPSMPASPGNDQQISDIMKSWDNGELDGVPCALLLDDCSEAELMQQQLSSSLGTGLDQQLIGMGQQQQQQQQQQGMLVGGWGGEG